MKPLCLIPAIFMLAHLPLFAAEDVQPFDLEKAKQAAQISDPEAATRAYLDSVPADRRAKTKSYANGNYILDFVEFFFNSLILIALLAFGISVKMRNFARRITRRLTLQRAVYWIQYLLLTSIVTFPLTLYTDYFREKAYGLLTQAFGPWIVDQLKGLAIAIILGSLFLIILYGVLRRAPRTWWIWGTAVCVAFLMFSIVISPVFIQPLFNKFTPIQNADLREKILTMAHEYAIPADEVYEMDASKRTDRISAYVNGLLGTMRIVMFDNTMRRCTPEEIQMIMGHEMAHYVLNHIWKLVGFLGLLVLFGFLFVRWGFAKVTARWPSLGIEGISDLAGFPLLLLLLSAFLFFTGPITNTVSRTMEDEADDFGLMASKQPDAAATTFLKLGEYRDLEPKPWVEYLFYDHPSGRYRIRNAMLFKQSQTSP